MGRLNVFVEGGACAMAQWHYGQSPSLVAIHVFISPSGSKNNKSQKQKKYLANNVKA